MRHSKYRRQISHPGKFIVCKCGRSIYIPHPANVRNKRSGYKGVPVSHAHCIPCALEYHMQWNGYIYSHPVKRIAEKNAAKAKLTQFDPVLALDTAK